VLKSGQEHRIIVNPALLSKRFKCVKCGTAVFSAMFQRERGDFSEIVSVQADPVVNGNLVCSVVDGVLVVRSLRSSDGMMVRLRYVMHFARCPELSQGRQRHDLAPSLALLQD
jgi:hypothetical protein